MYTLRIPQVPTNQPSSVFRFIVARPFCNPIVQLENNDLQLLPRLIRPHALLQRNLE